MAQPGFGPPSLPVGTEVSAKYRGAFCEAKVKTVVKVVKCKIVMKDGQSNILVTDEEVKGLIKVGAVVEVKHPATGQPVEATITKLIDHSTYTVVFDDGDERTLRRTQLCLKGEKHFIESETLDNLPLSHPEHFGTPVLQNKKAKRKNDDESDNGEDKSEEESPRRVTYRGHHQELVGKLMLVDLPNRKGSVIPALVVLPDASSLCEVKNRDQILVRSFKDSKFMTVTRKSLKEFLRVVAIKNDDKTMRAAFEKALLYHDTKELPVGWDKIEMLGTDYETGDIDDEYESEDEPFEEKDRFVAQLYKFMDERGTPINKGPCIGNKDLNLYKLYKIVKNLGGYNKVTKEMKWPIVYNKMGLTSVHLSPAHQIKTAYKKYLDAFETFYRKLGSTMGTMSRPGRARQSAGRTMLSFRAREKLIRPPEKVTPNKDVPETTKQKAQISTEKSEDVQDAVSVTVPSDGDVVMRRTPRREAGIQSVKEESRSKKDEIEKQKKEESPKNKKEDKREASLPRSKKEEARTPKIKKEDAVSAKTKKDELVKGKKEDDVIKDERKSTRKIKLEEEKPIKGPKKEKEDEKKEEPKLDTVVPLKDSPKKRMTRSKMTPVEVKKECEVKEEIEEKKDAVKKSVNKELETGEKKEKELPKTLERRDSRASDKKESPVKLIEKKDTPGEKKIKPVEEKKPKDKKVKEDGEDEGSDDGKPLSVSAHSEEGEELDLEVRDYPLGSMLKVKYGRGKNQKIYIAKVVDYGRDGVHRTYLVHYTGWNTRYDEWIRADRVIAVLNRREEENARTPPSRSQSVVSCVVKDSLSPAPINAAKLSPDMAKSGQIFRTPKSAGSKTRSTRSSSSDTCVAKKRMTRRHSIMADSAGSRSPGSQMSSDSDESSDSDRGDEGDDDDDYDSSKEDDTREDNLLDAEEYDKADESVKYKSTDTEIYMEEADIKEESQSEITLDRGEEGVDNLKQTRKTSSKEANIFAKSVGDFSVESDESTETEEKIESEESFKRDTLKEEPIGKSVSNVNKVSSIFGIKRERASVTVVEVRDALYEIKSSVYYDKGDVKHEEEDECGLKMNRDVPEIIVDIEDTESPKLEIMVETNSVENEDQDEKTDLQAYQADTISESFTSAFVVDQSIPQLKKIDDEQEKKENQTEKTKSGKGKKYNAKDVKKSPKMSDIMVTGSSPDMPTAEPMFMGSVSSAGKVEPSPYDFDAEVDTPWQPEITKKWEPSKKAHIIVKEGKESLTASEEGEEKDKKVKKKVKIKPISSELAREDLNLSVDESVITDISEKVITSPSEDTYTEGKGSRKKGRKKREMSSETKKKVIEMYESTVNSVVEAVKHSLQETESDHEQRSAVKKRRIKRLSESDKKDSTTRVTRVGRKVASRDSLDVLNSSLDLDEHTNNLGKPTSYHSSPSNECVLPPSAQTNEISSASTSAQDSEENIDFKNIKMESSFCESQGFEPQLQNLDNSANFDNTPPTTPEHEGEENKSAAMQHAENLCHLSYLPSKSDPHKDSIQVLCSAASTVSPSVSLSCSSPNFASSRPANELPSDNDVTSTDNLDTALTAQQSEGSGTDQDCLNSKKRNVEETSNSVTEVKKRRVHGTRSRTAKKSPKYNGNSDSQGSASNTPNHCPESPPVKLADLSKSPRPSKYNFNADLGEYLEGEARCNFLINKMREIKSIYMTLKSEVASIDRRRKRAKRKEKESLQISCTDREVST